MRAFQISNGLGAGNTGDEIMARAFWAALSPEVVLEVPLHSGHAGQREPYPEPHAYVGLDRLGADMPGLLAGDTPVTESEGVHYPMQFLAPRLDYFHSRRLPVDAVGVGVDFLTSTEARRIFRRFYLPIRSWTVRSAACRASLLDLGVAEDRVAVGADWSWLHKPRADLRAWADDFWRSLGVDPARPLLVVNVVNMIWREEAPRRALASALDQLARDFQIAFFCQESRPGDFFDFDAARQTRVRMKARATIVPRLYYSADEMLGLLSHATAMVSQRYHFTLAGVLAGVVPVALVRGQKMRGLLCDLGLEPAGTVDGIDAARVVAAVKGRPARQSLDDAVQRLRQRAGENLDFLRKFYPEMMRPPDPSRSL